MRLSFLLFFIISNIFSEQYISSSITSATGVIRTPNSRFFEEGFASVNLANNDPIQHLRFTLSPYNWLEASFFYNDMNTLRYAGVIENQSNKDKGFSIKIKFSDESYFFPSFAIGLEDFAGTGFFSSEYLVASKSFNNIDFSMGLGWGRLGSLNNFDNIFRFIDESFLDRQSFTNSIGGVPEYKSYFRGDSSLFSSLVYKPLSSHNLLLKFEYDSNNFTSQAGYNAAESSRYNYGIAWKPTNFLEFGLYQTEGNDTAFNISLSKNFYSTNKLNVFKARRINNCNTIDEKYLCILRRLASENIYLQNASIDSSSVIISYIQNISNNEKKVASKIKEELHEIVPNVENIQLVSMQGSLPKEVLTYKNGYLVERGSPIPIKKDNFQFNPNIQYPVNSFSINPGTKSHIGSPVKFYFGELFLGFNFSSVLAKGLEFESKYTFPLFDNYRELDYDPSYTDVYPVRIDTQFFLREGQHGFDRFLFNHFNHQKQNWYSVFSVGHFEQMFSGFRYEILNKGSHEFISYGFETAYVKQRDYEKSFNKFRDYTVSSSHLNIYVYEPFLDFTLHASLGKYLAKDYGFTIDLSRSFPNGLQMGAFFTLTNLSAQQFGEGSFDKGVYFSYPLDVFSSGYKKGNRKYIYKPLTRDGGSKLDHNLYLYDILKTYSEVVF